jgi:hypothetical protein
VTDSKNPRKLTREEIIAASLVVPPARKTKWTVVIEGKQFPVRLVIFKALGVRPDYRMNSYQAIDILKGLDFEVRFKGNAL